ncbi:hypothetical protein [Mucilaginibacter terrae]|uniref:Universal stress protein n=1 Tax=Mucilaginibacter terrae TaxID=1955052 RepID=A0ABU3GUE0_9SPHI|nr:hypothetical protein [Mucilaginibacter terrae]MDT3403394.1 hypothetical protein [Mucilaginibacter terrae]
MITLLIPTDFNVKTLSCIPNLLQRLYLHKVSIILVHMLKITNNTHELFMLSKRSAEHQHISAAFNDACAKIKRKYADSLPNLRIEFFYGSTLAVFKNYLNTNEVHSIVMLENYPYGMLHKNSINPSVMVKRSGINIITIDYMDIRNEPVNKENILAEAV